MKKIKFSKKHNIYYINNNIYLIYRLMQRERISEINDNISDLTNELVERSEQVLKGK